MRSLISPYKNSNHRLSIFIAITSLENNVFVTFVVRIGKFGGKFVDLNIRVQPSQAMDLAISRL